MNCVGCGLGCEAVIEINEAGLRLRPGVDCPVANRWIASRNHLQDSLHLEVFAAADLPLNPNPPLNSVTGHPTAEPNAETANLLALLHATDAPRWLHECRAPLITGFAGLVAEQQRAIFELGQVIHGFVDWTTDNSPAQSIQALQRGGRVGCTLGEIRDRADLIVYWGFDPDRHSPRFRELFTSTDNQWSIATPVANTQHLPAPNRMAFCLSLIELVCPTATSTPRPGTPSRVSTEWRGLLTAFEASKYAVIVLNSQATGCDSVELEQLNRLVTLLNRANRQVRYVDVAGGLNSHGAENVSTWLTGYPLGIRFLGDPPRVEYDPQRYTAPQVLRNRLNDATIVVGELWADQLEPAALEHVQRNPLMVVGYSDIESRDRTHRVQATCTWSTGTTFRSDGIPLTADVPLLHFR